MNVIPEKLKKRDTFYMQFGFKHKKFIVKEVCDDFIVATCPDWLKSENQIIPFRDLRERINWISKPYSRLRWFLKF